MSILTGSSAGRRVRTSDGRPKAAVRILRAKHGLRLGFREGWGGRGPSLSLSGAGRGARLARGGSLPAPEEAAGRPGLLHPLPQQRERSAGAVRRPPCSWSSACRWSPTRALQRPRPLPPRRPVGPCRPTAAGVASADHLAVGGVPAVGSGGRPLRLCLSLVPDALSALFRQLAASRLSPQPCAGQLRGISGDLGPGVPHRHQGVSHS